MKRTDDSIERKNGRRTSKMAVAALASLLFLLTAVTYYPVLDSTFHEWDDDVYITANQHVLKGLDPGNVKWAFSTTYFGFYYPLTWLSHMTDIQLYGLDPRGHYATNILLHCANVVLLFFFLAISTGSRYRSFFAAGLFALHPMNVESVAWLAERKNLLSAFFLLLSLLFYVFKVKSRDDENKGALFTAGCYLFFILGLMSKSNIVMFPLLLLILDYWPLKRFSFDDLKKRKDILRKLAFEKLPLFIPAVISGMLTISAQNELKTLPSLTIIPIQQRIGEALLGFGFYIEKLFLPLDLCTIYPHHQGNYPIFLPVMIFAGMAAATFIFFMQRKERPALIAGWLFFIVSLVPVIGIIQAGSQAYADRYVYFAYWGLFALLAFGIFREGTVRGKPAAKILLAAASVSIFISLFLLTRSQAAKWKDDEALFSNVVKNSPGVVMGYLKLGNYYLSVNDFDKALSLFQKAYEIQKSDANILCDMGLVYLRLENLDRALYFYDLAIEAKPDCGIAYYNRACILTKMKRGAEALKDLEMAVKSGYDNAKIEETAKAARLVYFRELSKELIGQGKWDEAGAALKKAIDIDPERADLWCYMGYILQKKNDAEGARIVYEKALTLDDSLDIAIHNLAVIEFQNNETEKARTRLKVLEAMHSQYAAGLQRMLDKK